MKEGIRVLYVDDEPDLLDIAQLFLERNDDFQVTTATSAKIALDSSQIPSYDLIISDYQMPEINGLVFLKEVRRRYGDIPFILFTGRGREEVVIEAINNGVDFYLQKGGDPTAQFAELAHKIRQAVARKQAEHSRIESEKRLSDIINFLPDATFAIDKSGTVIAWNHAIEEMTGVPADEMLGKGDYEYAIPFYNKRRKILIDLIFEPDEVVAGFYTHILHEKNALIAETNLPRPKGKMLTVMSKASRLYNGQGEVVGAIESIRDISQSQQDAERLVQKTKTLSIINSIIQATNLQQTTDESIRTVLSSVLSFLHYDAGGVYLVDGDHTTARIVCEDNLDPAFVRMVDNIDIRTPPYDALFIRGEPIILNNFEIVHPQAAALSGLLSIASIPIVSQDSIIGALNVASMQRSVVSQDDLDTLVAIGRELGSAITRIKGESALRESEEKYRTLVNLTPVAVLVHRAGKIVYANPESVRLAGARGFEELLGSDVLQFIRPDDNPVALEQIRLMNSGATIPLTEMRIVTIDQRTFTVELAGKPVIYEGLPSVIVVYRDISDRKKKEDELRVAYEQIAAAEEELREQYDELARGEHLLRESQVQLRAFMDSATDAFTIWDASFNLVDLNRVALSSLPKGTEKDEVIGKNLKEYMSGSGVWNDYDRFFEVIRTGIPFIGVDRITDLTCGRRWMDIKCFRVGNGLGIITSDITREKEAEVDLRESEKRFRHILENMQDAYIRTDVKGNISMVNPSAFRMFRYRSAEDMTGIPVNSLYPREGDRVDLVRIVQDSGGVTNFSGEAVRLDGTTFPASINVQIVRDENDRMVGTEAIIRDMSEMKEKSRTIRSDE